MVEYAYVYKNIYINKNVYIDIFSYIWTYKRNPGELLCDILTNVFDCFVLQIAEFLLFCCAKILLLFTNPPLSVSYIQQDVENIVIEIMQTADLKHQKKIPQFSWIKPAFLDKCIFLLFSFFLNCPT